MADAMTLGRFREATKDGSEFVPLLVNGQPVTTASLVRDTGTGDLACHLVAPGSPVEAPPAPAALDSEPGAPSPEPVPEVPAVDETDRLELEAPQGEASSEGSEGSDNGDAPGIGDSDVL